MSTTYPRFTSPCTSRLPHTSYFTRSLWALFCFCIIAAGMVVFPEQSFAASRATPTPQEVAFLRAGVSVVRLVTTYTPSNNEPAGQGNPKSSISEQVNAVICTGLGVIVASQQGTGNEANNSNAWILTDSALVDKNPSCNGASSNTSNFSLLSIQILLSSAYTNTLSPISVPISSVHIGDQPQTKSFALVEFNTSSPLPFLTIQNAPEASSGITAVTLSNSSGSPNIPDSTIALTALEKYNIPAQVTVTDLNKHQFGVTNPEPGMPIVNENGLVDLNTSAPVDPRFATDAQTLLNANIPQSAFNNPVDTDWNKAVQDYANGSQSAPADFTKTYTDSGNQFVGASTVCTTSSFKKDCVFPSGGGGKTNSNSNNVFSSLFGFIIANPFLLIVIVVCIIALLVLLIFLNSLFKRGQREKPVPANEARASTGSLQAGNGMVTSQHQGALGQAAFASPPQQPLPMPQMSEMSPVLQHNYNGHGMPGSITPPIPPAPPIQASPVLPPQPIPVASSLADKPTLVDAAQFGSPNGQIDLDKTIPFAMSQYATTQPMTQPAKELGFEVITNTDPGLKRQYKPNEDSIFAVHGVRDYHGSLQQIGLFIVADGMGGHADGKVASTLAIQTVIDTVLPRLVHNEEPIDNPAQLLSDGVQRANNAVHQHNMNNHGDMGTTVTATMLIGSTAFVANVGDSRTYLYRPSQGLNKITRDHSVVASLVDAGIIKEEDIYTHNKRNQIYRSLGEKPYVEVDTFTEQLQPNDKLLLCSDGMWEMVRDPNIRKILEEPVSDPKEMGNRLIQAALNGGGEDNVSVIVVNVLDTPPTTMQVGFNTISIQEGVKLPQL